ncbi:MAG TPA: hypothetical protein VKT49_09905 [Bryobacteraceae bacterium]|nr:hypothetical protein [Bryobacteraceae bacterium]
MLRPIKLAPVLLVFPSLIQAQTPQLNAIMERLDRLEQENRTLSDEVKSLRGELASLRGAAETNQAATAGRVDLQERRIEEQAQSKVEASQKFPIRLTGMALFNAFADSKQSGGVDYPVVAAPQGPGHAGATVRQSILGLEYRGPKAFWGGTVHGSVYMDFFSGTPPLNQTMRLRTGSIEIDWASRSLMAGIEKPIFNPREPSSLAQVGVSPLTGAGNLWLWLPQVRVEQDIAFASQTGVRAQLGVVQTREVGPYAGSSVPAGNIEASRPGLEGRFEFYHKFGEERRLEVAPGFHVSTTHASGFSVPSQVFSLDWFINPSPRFEFTGAFYHGKNVAFLGAGYRQGFGLYQNEADAVRSQGGWGQFTFHLLPRLDLHLLSGQQDDRNSDLVAGNIAKNLFFGSNLYFRLAPNVILSPEISQVRTVYLGQATRLNNHYDLALGYLF